MLEQFTAKLTVRLTAKEGYSSHTVANVETEEVIHTDDPATALEALRGIVGDSLLRAEGQAGAFARLQEARAAAEAVAE